MINYIKMNSSLITLTTGIFFFLGEAIFLEDNLFLGEINRTDDLG